MSIRLSDLAEKMEGTILQGSLSLSFTKFNIDSRLTEPGELFFALIANRNGHHFVSSAIEKGALGAVVSQDITLPNKNVAIIKVKDTLKALQTLAQKVLAEYPVKVIGITGSTGKTTTKEFTASLLSRSFKVLKSEGNFNNHLGLPLSLLKLTDSHDVAVLEMAMSSQGEIKTLTQIASPDIAVITNIYPVHLQFFQNMKEIAQTKKEILDGSKDNGIAVLNGDDSWIKKIAKDFKGKKLFFGISPQCRIRAMNLQKLGWNGISFDLNYSGKKEKINFPFVYESYLYNLLAAITVANALYVPIKDVIRQIPTLKPLPMRGTLIHLRHEIKLMDDSYNSNPHALELALKGLSHLPAKRKIAVLGDMLELGEKEVQYHIQAGKQVAKWRWDILITIGTLSQHMVEGALSLGMKKKQTYSFRNSEEAAEEIDLMLKEGDFILIKGSRGIKTEKIISKLKSKGS